MGTKRDGVVICWKVVGGGKQLNLPGPLKQRPPPALVTAYSSSVVVNAGVHGTELQSGGGGMVGSSKFCIYLHLPLFGCSVVLLQACVQVEHRTGTATNS